MTDLQQLKNDLMKDSDFKREYEDLKPEDDLVRQILNYREQNNLTQEHLAKKVGIPRSNIARLESGNYNPTLAFLRKIATGMNKQIMIKFV